MAYRYKARVLEALSGHGVRPMSETRPELVHEFVRDLYRHEIRRLRERLLRGEFPRREYADRVVALRKRYWVTSLRPHEWIEEER
ncbi:MAG TPA: hypothetical protein VL309_10320 [Vicinamibacterales bacterium]|nr:hypothetical protein [Vicinamibacterales bacterium]